ncbi:hypothetical protein FRC00_008558 [Tulasnella sp. 408]|nr:hypothetical protein FRC00_008558 [Tulasnella sp. 408]
MSTLVELREQIEKAERRLKLVGLQTVQYHTIIQQETEIAYKISDRILDIGTSLEASDDQQHRIQERLLSCVEKKDDNGVLVGKKELVDLTFNSRKLVDQRTAMGEMKEAAEQKVRGLERQVEKLETTYWNLLMDLRALRKQYTQMGGTFDQS